jgi:dihydroneopterin aldolase
MDKIYINNLSFYAYHGVLEEEQKIGGQFIVDLTLYVDLISACNTDDLSCTINYQKVCELVKAEMDIPSKLIEHVSGRIVNSLFNVFNTLNAVKIKLTKINPPVQQNLESVSVELYREKTN